MPYPSSFPGRLAEVPGVSVDNFTDENVSSRAFFLSHCHTDHMQGLHSLELQQTLRDGAGTVRVYMSEMSAAIVRQTASSILSDAITVLNFDAVHIRLPATKHLREEHITVSAVPAGHCLGSVMFLFRTSRDETVLFTGDFRITHSDVDKLAQLHSKGEPISIDTLYIDTTFLDPNYSDFPIRTDCMDELERYIVSWLRSSEDNCVALSTSASYGYEFLYVELSTRLKTKIFVHRDKWDFYSKFKLLEAAVTNVECGSRVHACRNVSEGHGHERCGLSGLQPKNLLFIRMSAQRFKNYELYASPIRRTSESRLDVCYPTHSSSSEIRSFVAYYDPKRIVGFPYAYQREGSDGKRHRQTTPVASPKKKKLSPLTKNNLIDQKEDRVVLKKLFEEF